MPYIEWIDDIGLHRVFSCNIDQDLLEWHRDHNTRIVQVLKGEGWEIQLDDELPMLLKRYDRVKIKKNVFHRLFKGSTDLEVLIEEINE